MTTNPESPEPDSLLAALVSGAAVSLLAMALLSLVVSALMSPFAEIAWVLCAALGLFVLRRRRPLAIGVQVVFVIVMLALTAAFSFVLSWYVLGERL